MFKGLMVICIRVGMKGIEVVAYLGMPIPVVFHHRSCHQKLWCIREGILYWPFVMGAPPSMKSPEKIQCAREWIHASSVPPLGEPPDLKRVSSLGFGEFSGHGFLLFPGMAASGGGRTLPSTV
ncbi:hypothetical protein TIFTF001_015072 [Ficus carica]|uniref:Uncharacterized protein n=1 Tax=Ficus carica TaxID=3494 RepID=A0AA88D7J2_FICCA|nr:hypothetical protein TIFTF001_015072 [Ficus carica]